MRVYLDTGVFIDYLTQNGRLGRFLRGKRSRRNRTIQQLHEDVSDCLEKICKNHDGFASCFAIYEAEDALCKELMKASKGIANGKKFAVMSSRNLNLQIFAIKKLYKLQIMDLTEQTFDEEIKLTDLQERGIQAGDSLHVISAILANVDIIITTDRHILGLNNIYKNKNGKQIKCMDTNIAKNML